MASRDLSGLASLSGAGEQDPAKEEDLPVLAEEERQHHRNGVVGGLMSHNKKRLLTKQLSMKETTREAKWEKRRKQILHRRKAMMMSTAAAAGADGAAVEQAPPGRLSRVMSLTDGDLDELRGSIELGFGFDEENGGHSLCDTLPALDLYFAVNRQFSSSSSSSTPTANSSSPNLCGGGTPGSPRSPCCGQANECWIVNPEEDPQQVKMRLRHWAQVVACSVKQSRN